MDWTGLDTYLHWKTGLLFGCEPGLYWERPRQFGDFSWTVYLLVLPFLEYQVPLRTTAYKWKWHFHSRAAPRHRCQ